MARGQALHAVEHERLLTPATVAAELNISLAAVYNLIRSGELQSVNLASAGRAGSKGLYRIRREWVDDLLNKRLVSEAARPAEAPCNTRHRDTSRVQKAIPNYLRL
ncbi:MAG: helix-turn-helix domain-containing protein [Planctomycetes bacterium]|nr:helix-turn-helix domain-containing protein [Planctomycetota bacterium]